MRALHNGFMGFGLAIVLTVSVGAWQPWTSVAEAQQDEATAAPSPSPQHTAAGHPQHGEAQHGQHSGQHGEMSDTQAHFHMFAEQLGLSDEQQHAVAEAFHEAIAAMQALHHAHDAIVEHLTDEQTQKMAEMIHEMLGAQLAAPGHGTEALHEGH